MFTNKLYLIKMIKFINRGFNHSMVLHTDQEVTFLNHRFVLKLEDNLRI